MSYMDGLGDFTLGDQLKRFGTGVVATGAAVLDMTKAPSTMDQSTQSWFTIVKGAQFGLREAGATIPKIDGIITPKAFTDKALVKASGANWRMKPWTNIYKDIIAAQKDGRFKSRGATSNDPAPPVVDDIGEPGGFGLSTTSTLLLVGAVGVLLLLKKKKKK